MPALFDITAMDGRSGRLRDGSRPLTLFKKWSARPVNKEAGLWRLTVDQHIPNPLNWQDFDVGRTLTVSVETVGGTHTGRARIISLEPLVLEVWEMDRA